MEKGYYKKSTEDMKKSATSQSTIKMEKGYYEVKFFEPSIDLRRNPQ